ncbi:MAG: outer membrane beta-barrel protein [candidate division Zixibacteria bacterium]|nr:outer membrane beta-barrel protein [candidate division Zixibacteria bacterium]
MKLITIIAAVLLLAMTLTAADNPTDKGSMMLNGNASFTSVSLDSLTDDESLTTINIIPSIGFFIAPNIMVGGDLEYIKLSYGDVSASSFGIGPTVGYYFNMDKTRLDAKGAIYPYIKGFFIWTTTSPSLEEDMEIGDTVITADDEMPKLKTTTYGFEGGLIFMLSNSVGADFNVRYSIDKYKPDIEGEDTESVDGNTLNIGVGITAFIY